MHLCSKYYCNLYIVIITLLSCKRVHQNVNLHISFLIFYGNLIGCIILLPQEVLWLLIGYKNTISGGSSIMQPIRIPENTRNVILLMNLILDLHDLADLHRVSWSSNLLVWCTDHGTAPVELGQTSRVTQRQLKFFYKGCTNFVLVIKMPGGLQWILES